LTKKDGREWLKLQKGFKILDSKYLEGEMGASERNLHSGRQSCHILDIAGSNTCPAMGRKKNGVENTDLDAQGGLW
jgi:hypothetical protein